MLSFIVNSIQNTLPHPIKLRRWKIQSEVNCSLCGWRNAELKHILCGCQFVLEQGRISYRHGSILLVIRKSLAKKVSSVQEMRPIVTGMEPIVFVKRGKRVRRTKKDSCGIIDAATDWVLQVDLRKQQTHFPPHIITTADRPDIVMYSDQAKVVVLIELTSPAEENLEKWRSG